MVIGLTEDVALRAVAIFERVWIKLIAGSDRESGQIYVLLSAEI